MTLTEIRNLRRDLRYVSTSLRSCRRLPWPLLLNWGRARMAERDIDYFRQRAAQERDHASAAERENVAEIHLELARLYDAMVNEPALRPTLRIAF